MQLNQGSYSLQASLTFKLYIGFQLATAEQWYLYDTLPNTSFLFSSFESGFDQLARRLAGPEATETGAATPTAGATVGTKIAGWAQSKLMAQAVASMPQAASTALPPE